MKAENRVFFEKVLDEIDEKYTDEAAEQLCSGAPSVREQSLSAEKAIEIGGSTEKHGSLRRTIIMIGSAAAAVVLVGGVVFGLRDKLPLTQEMSGTSASETADATTQAVNETEHEEQIEEIQQTITQDYDIDSDNTVITPSEMAFTMDLGVFESYFMGKWELGSSAVTELDYVTVGDFGLDDSLAGFYADAFGGYMGVEKDGEWTLYFVPDIQPRKMYTYNNVLSVMRSDYSSSCTYHGVTDNNKHQLGYIGLEKLRLDIGAEEQFLTEMSVTDGAGTVWVRSKDASLCSLTEKQLYNAYMRGRYIAYDEVSVELLMLFSREEAPDKQCWLNITVDNAGGALAVHMTNPEDIGYSADSDTSEVVFSNGVSNGISYDFEMLEKVFFGEWSEAEKGELTLEFSYSEGFDGLGGWGGYRGAFETDYGWYMETLEGGMGNVYYVPKAAPHMMYQYEYWGQPTSRDEYFISYIKSSDIFNTEIRRSALSQFGIARLSEKMGDGFADVSEHLYDSIVYEDEVYVTEPTDIFWGFGKLYLHDHSDNSVTFGVRFFPEGLTPDVTNDPQMRYFLLNYIKTDGKWALNTISDTDPAVFMPEVVSTELSQKVVSGVESTNLMIRQDQVRKGEEFLDKLCRTAISAEFMPLGGREYYVLRYINNNMAAPETQCEILYYSLAEYSVVQTDMDSVSACVDDEGSLYYISTVRTKDKDICKATKLTKSGGNVVRTLFDGSSLLCSIDIVGGELLCSTPDMQYVLDRDTLEIVSTINADAAQ